AVLIKCAAEGFDGVLDGIHSRLKLVLAFLEFFLQIALLFGGQFLGFQELPGIGRHFPRPRHSEFDQSHGERRHDDVKYSPSAKDNQAGSRVMADRQEALSRASREAGTAMASSRTRITSLAIEVRMAQRSASRPRDASGFAAALARIAL